MELVSALTDTPIRPRAYALGECMVEMTRSAEGRNSWELGHGGDTYNVAAYMQRLGCSAVYLTALGSDEFSDDLRRAIAHDEVEIRHVLAHPTRTVGLYAVRVDGRGERSFTYWRGESAARAFFECPGAAEAIAEAKTADLFYTSGITLSLFDTNAQAKIEEIAAAVRSNGGVVAFDTNYRPRGWASPEQARSAMQKFARHASIVLPTLEDDRALFGDISAVACASRWHSLGVEEVAVKLGAQGAFVSLSGVGTSVYPVQVVQPCDTTGAGDSFNAGYLSARLTGAAPEEAARQGNTLAGIVVTHPGAIIPKRAMASQAFPHPTRSLG